MNERAQPLIIRPQDHDGVPSAAGGDVYSTLATGAQTAGGYFLTHAIVPPGGGPPPHIHTREEEAFYIVRGDLRFLLDDETIDASSGSFVHVPRGWKHQFHNPTDKEVEMIFWFTPAGIEGLFEELGARPEDIIKIGEKYGVEYFLDEWGR